MLALHNYCKPYDQRQGGLIDAAESERADHLFDCLKNKASNAHRTSSNRLSNCATRCSFERLQV